ncbi:MAG: phosphate/phosphite/phosphonate ABC transporter substrate-binding protein [Paracoccaceae bacterium]
MTIRTLLTATALTCAVALPAAAEFALDARYVDNDGDMVADIPTDPAQLVDPATLIFAYTPVEDPAVYAGVWADFLTHMESVTGKKVQFFPIDSNAAQIEAMRAGRLHVAGFNTGSNPLAIACAGFRPFAMMADFDDSFGYEMEIITYPGSGIEKIEDIKGRTLAFSAETSNSGYKAPAALLAAKYDMKADVDYKTTFSGKHDNSILGVVNKDYDSAAIANRVAWRMAERGVIKMEDYVTIYKSETFPTTGYGVAHNLTPELQEKVREAFFSFDWKGTAMEKEFGPAGQNKFVPITFKDNWSVVREIDAAMGVQYTCQ